MVSSANKFLISSSLVITLLQLVSTVVLVKDDGTSKFNYNCYINSTVDERPRLGISAQDQITILVSDRVTHQLVSRIFAIQLSEFFGFKNVILKQIGQTIDTISFDPNSILNLEHHKLYEELYELVPSKPEQIVNLEVWMLPDYNELPHDVSIVGPIFSPGRFGFFMPRVLHQNTTTEYFSYKMFGGSRSTSINEYVMKNNVLEFLRYENGNSSLQQIKSLEEYVPNHCNNKTCAHLLAPADCQFIIKHINHLKLYIRVIFIRNNFNMIVDRLIKLYIHDAALVLAQSKFIILHWYPSDLTMGPYDMIKFEMPLCEQLENECKYDLTPVLKMCSKPFLSNHLALSLSENFRFDSIKLHNLLKLYESKRMSGNLSYRTANDQIYNDVSCEYVKKTYNYDELQSQYTSFVKDQIVIGAWFISNDVDVQSLMTSANMAKLSVNNYLTNLNGFANDTIFFEVRHVRINCTSDEAMNNFLSSYYSDTQLVGFIGPICEEMIESIAGLSKHFSLPFISYAGEGSFLSDRSKYPYIYRTIGENRDIEKIYMHIFNKFLWTRVATLSEEGLKTANYLIHLDELLKHSDKELVANKKFDCHGRNSLLDQQLKYLKSINVYIIIADVSDTCLYSFACELFKNKMTSEYGYVWFLPDWSLRHINKLNTSYGSCSFDQLHEAINGHFSLMHMSYINDNVTTVEQKTIKQWRDEYYDNVIGDDKYISNDAGFLYDSIWTYGIALNNLFKIRKRYKRRDLVKDLAKEIARIKFDGISGNVYFDESGSRLIDINLMQSQNRNLYVIGTYEPKFVQLGNKSTLNWEGHLNESAIVWFTKLGQIPTDGRKICSFNMLANLLNTSCEVATAVVVCLGCILFVVLLSTGSFIFWKWKYDKKMEFMKKNGIDLLSELSENTLDKWEIPKERIVINRKLGEGAFGTVYGGEAQLIEDSAWTAVAVKTLKMGSTREDRLNFLAEAETMKRFDHKNIIKLLGVCLSSEPIYTVMEYMLYGDLKTFLLARRHLVNEKNTDESDLSPKRLTQMALDIAKALSYLSNEKFVHRDIACRNCLVNANKLVKLGDFGMARSMFENDYYKFNRKGMLPVRWMAPESLVLGIFTPASDIWSFGVLIYEFITFGAFPFQGMTNNEVLEYIKQGNTLTIPNGVKPQLEYLMRSCWKREYRDRLKASEICDYLITNPRIITACIDDPLSSVQINDSETDQIELLKRLNIRPIGGDIAKSPNNNLTTGSLKRESNGHDVPATQTRNLSYIEMNTLNLLPKQQNTSLSPHYNPIEPLIVRSDSDISKSNTSLRRYVPMCGFNKNKSVPLNGDYESDFN